MLFGEEDYIQQHSSEPPSPFRPPHSQDVAITWLKPGCTAEGLACMFSGNTYLRNPAMSARKSGHYFLTL